MSGRREVRGELPELGARLSFLHDNAHIYHDRFSVEIAKLGGRLELFEAKWTEAPAASDAVNLDFVRNVVGKSRIAGGAIICRTSNSFPMADGLRVLPVTELESCGAHT